MAETAPLTFRVPAEAVRKLDELAAALGLRRSDMARQALRRGLRKLEEEVQVSGLQALAAS